MAKKKPTKKEIDGMSYEARYRQFKAEETELLRNAIHVSSVELAQKHKELVELWRV